MKKEQNDGVKLNTVTRCMERRVHLPALWYPVGATCCNLEAPCLLFSYL